MKVDILVNKDEYKENKRGPNVNYYCTVGGVPLSDQAVNNAQSISRITTTALTSGTHEHVLVEASNRPHPTNQNTLRLNNTAHPVPAVLKTYVPLRSLLLTDSLL